MATQPTQTCQIAEQTLMPHTTISITKNALAKLVDLAQYFPNPDDPNEPHGPLGPVSRRELGLIAALLRFDPQPQPWRFGPQPDPWLSDYPNPPRPWLSGLIARTTINQAVAQYRFAETLAGQEHLEKAAAAIGSQIREFTDDFCGNGRPRWPWPWPPKFDPATLGPIELLIAGAQFHKAAQLDNPLRTFFTTAADQLFATGLQRLEGKGEKNSVA
jgi:hypothetical protein